MDNRTLACAIEDCPAPSLTRGWCSKHYQRWLNNGDPLLNRKTARRLPCLVEGCARVEHARQLCGNHYQTWRKHGTPTPTPQTRMEIFMARVDKDGPIAKLKPELGRCWVWTGTLRQSGYGAFTPSRPGPSRAAHCWLYEQTIGPIPDGLDLDHFACENRACVRPSHVRPATRRENVLRSAISLPALQRARMECPQGHRYEGANLLVKKGTRQCRTCHRDRERRRRAAQRQAAASS